VLIVANAKFKSEIYLKPNFVTENTHPRHYEVFSLSQSHTSFTTHT